MKTQAVALYARVSSEQQTQAKTIDSQLAALRERIARDRAVLSPEHEFVDRAADRAGYSGSTLIRPALEQLRCGGRRRRTRTALRVCARSAGA